MVGVAFTGTQLLGCMVGLLSSCQALPPPAGQVTRRSPEARVTLMAATGSMETITLAVLLAVLGSNTPEETFPTRVEPGFGLFACAMMWITVPLPLGKFGKVQLTDCGVEALQVPSQLTKLVS